MTFFDLLHRRRYTAIYVVCVLYLAYVVTVFDVWGSR